MKNETKYDGVLLAGTHRNVKRLIDGKNKAFLPINGVPMVVITAQQMLDCPKLNRVVVVGPRKELESVMAPLLEEHPRLKIIQQRSRMLENVWNGFLATFSDGNHLPMNKEIDALLLGGHFPIKKQYQLYIIKSIYAAVAREMDQTGTHTLSKKTVLLLMERRIDEFRKRFERVNWFTGKITVNTILAEGHVLSESSNGICFQNEEQYTHFLEWDRRLNKEIFLTGCDLPLLVPEAITDFVSCCERYKDDFFFSVATENVLKPYYRGVHGSPGIKRPYVWLREAKIRAANLILVKPNRIGNKELIQESFGIRKMTEWRNMLAMIWKLLRLKHGYQTTRLALALCVISIFRRWGLVRAAEWMRNRTRWEELELSFCRIFKTRFKLIDIPYGGVSLDVDCLEDYDKITKNITYWKDIQEQFTTEFNDRKSHSSMNMTGMIKSDGNPDRPVD
jgi:hypothetical protein